MANKANMEVYNTQQAADALSLSTSSVRKYCVELERAGKVFVKSNSGARLLDATDLKTLKYMQRAINKGAKYPAAAEQAVKAVSINAVMTQEEPPEQASDADIKAVIGELVNEVRSLRAEVAFLKQAELDRQHAEALRIENEAVTSVTEARTAAHEEKVLPQTEKTPEPRRPGLFARIFGRG